MLLSEKGASTEIFCCHLCSCLSHLKCNDKTKKAFPSFLLWLELKLKFLYTIRHQTSPKCLWRFSYKEAVHAVVNYH